ncbi:hypothetical protein LEP1GSC172_3719 [Leptospira noguchii]|uniref:Uncharacterized protein n=1 Tax=Leptospira noguchii TaxID=28182 RepID=M6V9W5_9LEPT|nr:hypothetical protein LEP1GSC172_3719 [Leptospira noguchii]
MRKGSMNELSTTLPMRRVVRSSYWYFIKTEFGSEISQ